jgi:transforming growth factor-beta-induced protein
VVSGVQTSEALAATESLQSQAGAPLTFALEEGTIVIDETAAIGCADVDTANGVTHLVDGVLMPPADDATPPTTAAG